MYTLEMARAHIQELHEMAERSRPVGRHNTLNRVKKFVARTRTGR
ncbi:hypothetical protein [Yinghuangia seranimata]|nr:hypothetical protein [Yinghuangia seranimata]MDI2127027.1 hypothetical protein [Yinghuangia seranimata]